MLLKVHIHAVPIALGWLAYLHRQNGDPVCFGYPVVYVCPFWFVQ